MTEAFVLLGGAGILALLFALTRSERWWVLGFGMASGFCFGQVVTLLQMVDAMLKLRP